MPNAKGFTLIEMLVAVVIFSLVVGVVFYAFSQSVSLWERADREVEKLDQLVFAEQWVNTLFRATENLMVFFNKRSAPLFWGEQAKAVFITSNPLLNGRNIASVVRLEFKNGGLFYAEENLFKTESVLKRADTPSLDFKTEYPLITPVDRGRISFMAWAEGKPVWTESFDSAKQMQIPLAVKIAFSFQGKDIEFLCPILADSAPRDIVRWRQVF
jgi:prepilin-type N-terminal cleavage/methylation domain-containing protein